MSPFIVTTNRPTDVGLQSRDVPLTVSTLAVSTLEERIVFDANEWRNAGYDQPGGNERFWHHALILETHAERAGSGAHREKLATLLFLHDGRESRGHLLNAMNSIEAEARVISESGGAVGPLPDKTTIQVEPVSWFWLAREAGHPWRYAGSKSSSTIPTEEAKASILAAFNAKQGWLDAVSKRT